MRRYATYFDSNYLMRGLALYRSLRRHAGEFTLSVLCLDDGCARTLERLALPGLEPVRLAELESADPELLAVRATRSRAEYYFTSTPALLVHLMKSVPAGESLTYLDADLYFFSAAEPIFTERPHSILIIGHRFPERLRHLEEHGVYNVGLLSFVHDANGRRCLEWWRERCIEWCYDRVEPGRFADQKYLDDWPSRFAGVHVLEHRGANVAPWNVDVHPVRLHEGAPRVGTDPLIFYHVHGLKRLLRGVWDSGLGVYGARMTPDLRDGVYRPYLAELSDVERWVDERAPDPERRSGSVRQVRRPYVTIAKGLLHGSLLIGAGRP